MRLLSSHGSTAVLNIMVLTFCKSLRSKGSEWQGSRKGSRRGIQHNGSTRVLKYTAGVPMRALINFTRFLSSSWLIKQSF